MTSCMQSSLSFLPVQNGIILPEMEVNLKSGHDVQGVFTVSFPSIHIFCWQFPLVMIAIAVFILSLSVIVAWII